MGETVAFPLIVALETDLVLAARIASTVSAAGAQSLIVSDGDALWTAIDRWPELIIIDLDVEGWAGPVRWAKNQPHTRAIRIVAFDSGAEVERLRTAQAAGCDPIWPRARFIAELPALLRAVLHPPTRWAEGWNDLPPPALCRGVAQFNAAEFWACHETLEALWMMEPRPVRDLYQGILQIGIACHHLRRRNYAGTIKMLRRGLPRLRDLPEICQGVSVTQLYNAARAIHDQTIALGPERIGELAQANMPHIEIAGCAAG